MTTPATSAPTPDTPAPTSDAADASAGLLAELAPLLAAESDAEAPAAGVDPGDLEQAVWLRLLERLRETGAPERPAEWLRRAVRAEARRARRTSDRERPYRDEPAHEPGGAEPHGSPEHSLLAAEGRRALRAAVTRTPAAAPASSPRCSTRRTPPTAKSQESWVSHRGVWGRHVPVAWDACAECWLQRFPPPAVGEGCVEPMIDR